MGLKQSANKENIQQVNETTNADKNEKAAYASMALADLRLEVDRAHAAMSEARLISDIDVVAPLLDKFQISAHRARNTITQLADTSYVGKLKPKLEKFLAHGEGLSSLFAAKRAKLSLVQDLPRLIAENRSHIEGLVMNAEETAKIAALHSIEAVEEARASILASRNFITILVISSFVFSLLFAWYYVGQGVIKRLLRLNDANAPARKRQSRC